MEVQRLQLQQDLMYETLEGIVASSDLSEILLEVIA
jgi:hypothetical protein